jgi:hypothetical protein
MAPWTGPRTYLNFTLDPADARHIYEPATYERLRTVKADYDPENIFRGLPEIPLAARVARAA